MADHEHMWYDSCVEHYADSEGGSCRIDNRCYWCGLTEREAPPKCTVEMKIYPIRKAGVPFRLIPEDLHA